MSYASLRAIAKETDIPVNELSELAKKLNLGQPGPHKNSPRRFSGEDFDKLTCAALKASIVKIEGTIGRLKNEAILFSEKKLSTARDMGRLHGLAAAMGHPAANKLRQLNSLVQEIDREQGQDPARIKALDLLNVQAKTRFLNAVNRYGERLDAILQDVHAKL